MFNASNATYMEKRIATAFSQIVVPKRSAARVALVNLPEGAQGVLTDCFRQFGMETIVLQGDVSHRLKREKFDACAMGLVPGTESILQAARGSPSNSRMIIYGVGGQARESLRFSKYGLNAVFNEPLERSAALKLVRATQMLVLHEYRRYVRLPLVTEVSVATGDSRRFAATSQEISSGGMSLTAPEGVSTGEPVEISFALLTLPRIWVRGTISWHKPASRTFGVRFDPRDERRLKIKEWIDGYVES